MGTTPTSHATGFGTRWVLQCRSQARQRIQPRMKGTQKELTRRGEKSRFVGASTLNRSSRMPSEGHVASRRGMAWSPDEL
jgi:hypothetical protein